MVLFKDSYNEGGGVVDLVGDVHLVLLGLGDVWVCTISQSRVYVPDLVQQGVIICLIGKLDESSTRLSLVNQIVLEPQ